MQKWEYKVINVGNFSQTAPELNRLGEQGWELVAVDDNFNCYFKRPK